MAEAQKHHTRPHLSAQTRRLLAAKGQAASRGRDTTEIDRAIAASRMEDLARSIVADWPPLREDQRTRIALILQGDSDV